ncbi:MAG: heme-binding domain-containing protein [Alphaproteobacteria bacterium]|nr:heme-binding domain-containing protein [Alphaproteobacteria bacterium]
MFRTILAYAGAAVTVTALGIQLVPYGRDHTNPPVTQEPAWDSPTTRELAVRACFDCHSNQTTWPWYSHVAPLSWLVQDHVDDGRRHLNFSTFDQPQHDADEAAEEVAEGKMPIANYVWLHPEADLTPAERDLLVAGLKATLGDEEGEGGENGDEAEDDDDEAGGWFGGDDDDDDD